MVRVCTQVAIIVRGVECISAMENYAAPVLIALTVGLLVWAYTAAGGLGPILAAPSQFVAGGARHGEFWQQFWPLLTACVGFWGTLALNIADFTRCASSLGFALGSLGRSAGVSSTTRRASSAPINNPSQSSSYGLGTLAATP